ncbi:hypothetical protein F5Y04DRAFT_253726 [Hypomontagnella monticulosa]|nr:hypothetical protein F5Y04DRAFT_253726 [Hypomontagnella monticulosa]
MWPGWVDVAWSSSAVAAGATLFVVGNRGPRGRYGGGGGRCEDSGCCLGKIQGRSWLDRARVGSHRGYELGYVRVYRKMEAIMYRTRLA